jgi:hypothetical protein
MRRLSASLVIVAALALGACGGDDNKNDNASTTTGTTTQSTTGTTTGKSGNGGGKKNKRSSKKGGSKSKSESSGGSTTPSTATKTQATPSQGTTPTPNNPRAIAEKVCWQFLPNVIRRDLKRGKTTRQKVARNYSRGYPKDQRSQAYKGCLAGLKKI